MNYQSSKKLYILLQDATRLCYMTKRLPFQHKLVLLRAEKHHLKYLRLSRLRRINRIIKSFK